jgi:hypothetical protein
MSPLEQQKAPQLNAGPSDETTEPESVAPQFNTVGTGALSSSRKLRIKPCPNSDRNLWIYHAACRCVEGALSDDEAQALIEELLTRDPKPDEIERALRSARGENKTKTPRWPSVFPFLVNKVCEKSAVGVRELIERSPVPIHLDQPGNAETWIDWLFTSDALLCTGTKNSNVCTATREELKGHLGGYSLIVPSPMCARTGITKEGEMSARAESNTGPRRFLVVEFDKEPSLDRQSAVLWHLASYWPLACVVFSANKSLQGWFYCQGEPEEADGKLAKFFYYCVALGADRSMWTRCQLCRMPDGVRNDNKISDALAPLGAPLRRQAVVYCNREAIK